MMPATRRVLHEPFEESPALLASLASAMKHHAHALRSLAHSSASDEMQRRCLERSDCAEQRAVSLEEQSRQVELSLQISRSDGEPGGPASPQASRVDAAEASHQAS